MAYGNRTFQVWKCQGIGTATPSDKETQNTDAYFGEPVFRYSYYQGVKDGILAVTERYKFLTNIDLTGIHDEDKDKEPKETEKIEMVIADVPVYGAFRRL